MLPKLSEKRNKLIVITGPTAAGKTALAIKLAKKFRGEIISADSRQIYRGMNIGTAKPAKSELKSVRHHLIDIKNPNQSYTLAHFQHDAQKLIKLIQRRNHIPFLVGGTPFYINAIINNLAIPEVKPNPALRRKLEKLSAEKLFTILKKKDPRRAQTIDPQNKRRLIRALEIIEVLGKVPSSGVGRVPDVSSEALAKGEGRERSLLVLGLKKSDSELRRAISRRTDAMFRAGLVGEVKNLIRRYGRRKLFSGTIGYREVLGYLDGKSTLRQAHEQIKTHTWQYTRRQMTWFRKLPIHWVSSQTQAETEVTQFLLPKSTQLRRKR